MIEAVGIKNDILPRKLATKDARLIDIEREKDYDVYQYNAKASNDKKVMVGFLSAIFPGVGQAINEQWGKCVAVVASLAALTYIGTKISSLFSFMGNNKQSKAGNVLTVSALLGVYALSIVDAVKNAKSDVYVVKPKENNFKSNVDVKISQ